MPKYCDLLEHYFISAVMLVSETAGGIFVTFLCTILLGLYLNDLMQGVFV